jgi:hypothetical protein
MDWLGWAVFGVIATSLLTGVMILAQLAGWTRLDLPLMLGTIFVADPDRARVAGFFAHLGLGQIFAFGYAASFALLDTATWWLGAVLGLLHVMVAGTVLLPLLPGVHPRMASERSGPSAGPARLELRPFFAGDRHGGPHRLRGPARRAPRHRLNRAVLSGERHGRPGPLGAGRRG